MRRLIFLLLAKCWDNFSVIIVASFFYKSFTSEEFNPGLTFFKHVTTKHYKNIKMGFERKRTAVENTHVVMCKYEIIIAVCLKFK